MSEHKQREPSYTEIPIDKINELGEQGILVYRVRVNRRSDQGHLKSLGSLTLKREEMLTLDDSLRGYAGGGNFVCTAFPSDDMGRKLFSIDIRVDGPAKPTSQEVSRIHRHALAAGAENFVSGMLQNQALQNRDLPAWEVDRSSAPSAAFSSDEVALQQVQEERRQKRELEDKLKALEDRFRKQDEERLVQIEREREERNRREKEAERERHAMELKRLEDKIAQASAAPNLGTIVASLAPFVPVLTAIVSTRKDTAALETERQNKMLEMQMESMKTMMSATLNQRSDASKGIAEALKVAAPLVGPLLTTWLSNNGPKAQAELMSAQSEMNMTAIGMVAQLLEQASSGNEESPWLQLADRLLQGLGQIHEVVQKQQKQPSVMRQVGEAAAQQLTAAGQPVQQQAQVQATYGVQVADQVMAHAAVPSELKTREWHLLISMLHDKAPVDTVAEQLANHIWNLDSEDKLPSFLAKVFEAPEPTLKTLMQPLPIWQADPLYAKRVITKVIEILSAPEDDEDENEGAEDEAGEEETKEAAQ